MMQSDSHKHSDKITSSLTRLPLVSIFFAAVLMPMSAYSITMTIGDVDGFGFTNTSGLVSAQNTPADTNGNGIIEVGEYLPDLNYTVDNRVCTGCGDDFDNRSASEASSTVGAQWTDVALSTSFSGRPGLANDAQFIFNFIAPTAGDIDYGVDHFINFVFGDYDVVPMSAVVEGNTINFTTQAGNQDGLVKFAYALVPWADMVDGQVVIDIVAPNEPYVVFDYALLDTRPISDLPEPVTLALMGAGLLGLGFNRRRILHT